MSFPGEGAEIHISEETKPYADNQELDSPRSRE